MPQGKMGRYRLSILKVLVTIFTVVALTGVSFGAVLGIDAHDKSHGEIAVDVLEPEGLDH